MKDEENSEKDQQLENQNSLEISEEFEEGEGEKDLDLVENKKYTRIGNKVYDIDTLNRITIVRLTQAKVPPKKIRALLDISRTLVSKWSNYQKRVTKKLGTPPKLTKQQKEFLISKSEGKLTVLNKVSTRNLAIDFEKEFKIKISKSTVNILYENFGMPY